MQDTAVRTRRRRAAGGTEMWPRASAPVGFCNEGWHLPTSPYPAITVILPSCLPVTRYLGPHRCTLIPTSYPGAASALGVETSQLDCMLFSVWPSPSKCLGCMDVRQTVRLSSATWLSLKSFGGIYSTVLAVIQKFLDNPFKKLQILCAVCICGSDAGSLPSPYFRKIATCHQRLLIQTEQWLHGWMHLCAMQPRSPSFRACPNAFHASSGQNFFIILTTGAS
ncbi:hypothetical protein F4801DRAFT_461991 [Xylaria longipes]|nr:hypothetical protein F4801DRAFT_461991 [Xylaria longipes]